MLTKCNCNSCSTPIEFEAEDAGTTATCPQCGMETQLYIPNTIRAQPATYPAPPKRGGLKIAIAAGAGGLALVLGALLAAFWKDIIPPLVQVLGGTLAAVVVATIAVLLLVLAMLWILFPLFVYVRLTDMSKALHMIEHNTRR